MLHFYPLCIKKGENANLAMDRVSQEGRKGMFYLTMYSTHFLYSYMASKIYRTTQILHYFLQLAARVPLYASPTNRIAYTMAFVIPVMEYWLE